MRILLDQDDIQTALETHVETLGISGASGVSLSVQDGEIVAEVTMGEEDKPTPKKTTRKTTTRRTVKPPAKSKEPVNVEKTAETGSDGGDSGDGGPTEADAPSGDEAPKKSTKTKDENTQQGNLFGDSDSQSSDTNEEADQAESPKDYSQGKVIKKSSIFDVD